MTRIWGSQHMRRFRRFSFTIILYTDLRAQSLLTCTLCTVLENCHKYMPPTSSQSFFILSICRFWSVNWEIAPLSVYIVLMLYTPQVLERLPRIDWDQLSALLFVPCTRQFLNIVQSVVGPRIANYVACSWKLCSIKLWFLLLNIQDVENACMRWHKLSEDCHSYLSISCRSIWISCRSIWVKLSVVSCVEILDILDHEIVHIASQAW